ncbi:MAG: hypothetical protein OHK0037_04570 [Elainellaceae cyanobacterium]
MAKCNWGNVQLASAIRKEESAKCNAARHKCNRPSCRLNQRKLNHVLAIALVSPLLPKIGGI